MSTKDEVAVLIAALLAAVAGGILLGDLAARWL